MATPNQFVTGRSDERREAMLRRQNKALREDIDRLRQTAAAEEDLHEKESEQHRQIMATMNNAYHCKIGEILDLRRQNKALREDIDRLRQTAAAEEDLHEKESEQHRQIMATMNNAYHCKIGEILDLRRDFGKANTRISFLTAALMESLQIQIKSIEMERQEAVERIAGKHNDLAEQIIKLKNLVAGDENEYALARLRELEENM